MCNEGELRALEDKGFQKKEVLDLVRLRQLRQEGQCSEHLLDPGHLLFIRWLVYTGRMSEWGERAA